MSKILIPIKPKYVDLILSGEKKYEFRKTKPKNYDINKMIIYSTSPVMMVVGEVEVLDIIVDTIEELWKKCSCYSGVNKESFDNYYKNRCVGVAYKLGRIKIYSKPKTLKEIGINYVPQSFIYVD